MSRDRLQQLQQQAHSREHELLRTLRELPAHERENATLEVAGEFSLEKVQAGLPRNAALVEYFTVGERVVAALLTRSAVEIHPVTVLSRVTHILNLLRFQLSKFRMGKAYLQQFEGPFFRATQSHLESLYAELIAPIRPLLSGKHLIFVPHGPLHFLPFHALREGDQYLCDSFSVSYAPSATIFHVCQEKPAARNPASLVFGIPDERAPHILPEAESVASLLPGAQLFLGEQATSAVLRERGPICGSCGSMISSARAGTAATNSQRAAGRAERWRMGMGGTSDNALRAVLISRSI